VAIKQEGRAKKRQSAGGRRSSAVPQGGAKRSSEGRVKERQRLGSADRAQPWRAEQRGAGQRGDREDWCTEPTAEGWLP
jgi:hypothetical protein